MLLIGGAVGDALLQPGALLDCLRRGQPAPLTVQGFRLQGQLVRAGRGCASVSPILRGASARLDGAAPLGSRWRSHC